MAAGEHPELETPENRLLLACARTTLTEQHRAQIRTLLQTEIDWERLLSAARRHRVTLLLHRSLRAAGNGHDTNPNPECLRDHARAFAARNAFLVQALTRLLARFEAERIAVIPYKGPVIASLAYGDIRLREFNDLDFLIRPQDIARVGAVLRREGYETANRLTPREAAHVQREFKEYGFQSGLVVVEPHWSITARRFPFPIDYEGLWARAQLKPLGEATVRVFAPEDLLLIQCVTGGKSLWRRLELVCDVAEIINAFPGVDWNAVERRARAAGSERLLLVGLALATELLDAPVPDDIAERIAADRQVRRLRQRIVETLLGPREHRRPFKAIGDTVLATAHGHAGATVSSVAVSLANAHHTHAHPSATLSLADVALAPLSADRPCARLHCSADRAVLSECMGQCPRAQQDAMSGEDARRNPPVTVRAATERDAEPLTPLMISEAEHGLRFAPHVELDEGFSWRMRVVQKLTAPRTQILVAQSEGALVGYLELRAVGQKSESRAGLRRRLRTWGKSASVGSPVRMPARAIIEGCFVAESTRRQGVATALLDAALAWARAQAISRIELGVMAGNAEGRAFWQSRGFSTDRVLMAREV